MNGRKRSLGLHLVVSEEMPVIWAALAEKEDCDLDYQISGNIIKHRKNGLP